MTTEELLRLARERRIILQDRGRAVGIWSPNARVSRELRQAFKQQAPAVLAHIRAGTAGACPSAELHRPYWQYTDKTFICTACRRLALACAS